jgi:hypothetical protein
LRVTSLAFAEKVFIGRRGKGGEISGSAAGCQMPAPRFSVAGTATAPRAECGDCLSSSFYLSCSPTEWRMPQRKIARA